MPNDELKKMELFVDAMIADSREALNNGRGTAHSGCDVSKSGGVWAIVHTNEGDNDEVWTQLAEHFLAKFGEDRWAWDFYDHADNPAAHSIVVRMRGPRGYITAAGADCYHYVKAIKMAARW